MVCTSFFSSLLSHLHPQQCRYRRSLARILPSDIPSPSQEFDASLAERLHKLIHSAEGDHSLHLLSFTWICRALDVVVSTQASMTHFVNSHCARPVVMTVPSDKVIQQYMEDSVKMLDACCLLKESLAGIHAYVKACHCALKRLHSLKLIHQGEIQRAKQALLSAQHVQARMQQQGGANGMGTSPRFAGRRLQACSSMLRRMGHKLPCPPSHHHHHHHLDGTAFSSGCDAVSAALYGGETCALFFLRFLSTALSSPRGPRRSSCSMTPPRQQPTWGPYLLALQDQFNNEILHIQQKRTRECNTLLPELHTLDASLRQIWEALLKPAPISQKAKENLSVLVRSTTALADHVQSSIARLHSQLDCISLSIVDTRMALLRDETVKF